MQEKIVEKLNTSTTPVLDVYYGYFPKSAEISPVYPKEREKQILSCISEKAKREKYLVWKLLAIALKRSLGLQMEDCRFEKKENGQWVCDKCYFSLSHSHDVLAVAISTFPVGVDVEYIKTHNWKVAKKVFTQEELATFSLLTEEEKADFFVKKWTQKESVFKQNGNLENFSGESMRIEKETSRYYLSIASDYTEHLRIFDNVQV